MYVCMYVRMHVCMYARLYAWMGVCTCSYVFIGWERCAHVAALLFKVEACVRLGIASMTSTSLPCVWNQAFSKKVRSLELTYFSVYMYHRDTGITSSSKPNRI